MACWWIFFSSFFLSFSFPEVVKKRRERSFEVAATWKVVKVSIKVATLVKLDFTSFFSLQFFVWLLWNCFIDSSASSTTRKLWSKCWFSASGKFCFQGFSTDCVARFYVAFHIKQSFLCSKILTNKTSKSQKHKSHHFNRSNSQNYHANTRQHATIISGNKELISINFWVREKRG